MCWSAVWQREAFTFRQEISALTMLYWVHVDTATVSPREETNGPWTINEGNLRLRGNYHWYQYFSRSFYSMNFIFALPCGIIFFRPTLKRRRTCIKYGSETAWRFLWKPSIFFIIVCSFMSDSLWIWVKRHPFSTFSKTIFFLFETFGHFQELQRSHAFWSKIIKFGKFLKNHQIHNIPKFNFGP